MGGYVKLYRKIKNTSVWCDSDKLKLWIYCITEATHDSRTILVGNQKIELKRGQFTTGRYKLEDDFNKGVKPKKKVDGSTLFRWLKLFEECGMLHIKSTNKYSIVTVVNWDKYQIDEQQTNNKCTSVEHQLNNSCAQYKNVKNVKNIKKEINKEKIPYKEIIDCLNNLAKTNYRPTSKETKDKIKARWNEGFRLNDFETVIKNKCNDWLGTDMEKFLRPITLFGTKFESYLNQKPHKSIEDVPDWYHDTKQEEPDQKLLDEIAEIQRKLQMGE